MSAVFETIYDELANDIRVDMVFANMLVAKYDKATVRFYFVGDRLSSVKCGPVLIKCDDVIIGKNRILCNIEGRVVGNVYLK